MRLTVAGREESGELSLMGTEFLFGMTETF